jgi:NADH-quinone oxidoreductase subunit H
MLDFPLYAAQGLFQPPDPSSVFFQVLIFPGFLSIGLFVAAAIYLERKFLARVQLRIGPLYAGGILGIGQLVADGLKLILKEMIIPDGADKFFFIILPTIMVGVSATIVGVIPFSPDFTLTNNGPAPHYASTVGLLIVFALMAVHPTLVLLMGWASNSKYPFIGGVRSLLQQVAYEVPVWMSTLGVVMITGAITGNGFDLTNIILAQQTHTWFIILQPLAAILFFVAAIAEAERLPLDTPAADSEIVMGWLTEYSGANFLLAFMSLYIKTFAISLLFTVLFLGGWLGPGLPPLAWTIIKAWVVMFLIFLIRGMYPRTRIDLLLRTGWTRLLVLALLNLFLTAGVLVYLKAVGAV